LLIHPLFGFYWVLLKDKSAKIDEKYIRSKKLISILWIFEMAACDLKSGTKWQAGGILTLWGWRTMRNLGAEASVKPRSERVKRGLAIELKPL
jgi:hypothetical protein